MNFDDRIGIMKKASCCPLSLQMGSDDLKHSRFDRQNS